jgi:hypothetical protein
VTAKFSAAFSAAQALNWMVSWTTSRAYDSFNRIGKPPLRPVPLPELIGQAELEGGAMARCRICGAEYDDKGIHVVAVELRESFDTVACAETAQVQASRGRGLESELLERARRLRGHGVVSREDKPAC